MKKRISLLVCLVLMCSLTIGGTSGCSSNRAVAVQNRPAGVNDVLQQGMAEADGKPNDTAGQSSESGTVNEPQSKDNAAAKEAESTPDTASNPEAPSDVIDVDLTVLSSTMVYSEVYNMMSSPENYVGKTVKMQGSFALYHDEASGNYYFACLIQDATACCAQGIEFILKGEHKYPGDYPEVGAEICVIGMFDTYQEGDDTYCTLRDASLQ